MLKRLALFFVFLPSLAFAQYSLNSISAAPASVPIGGTVTIMASVKTTVAINNGILNVEIHDQNNNKVAQAWQANLAWTGTAALPAIINSAPLTFTVPATAVVGATYTVGVGTYDSTPNNLWWDLPAASFKIVAAVTNPPPVTTPPAASNTAPCVPHLYPVNYTIGAVPSTASANFNVYAAWICGLPTGYVTEVALGNLATDTSNILAFLSGNMTPTAALGLLNSASNPALTASEKAFTQGIIATNRPVASAVGNGQVYQATNGTLAALSGENVALGTRCDETNFLGGYFSVVGQPDQKGTPLPANTYAACNVWLPYYGANY